MYVALLNTVPAATAISIPSKSFVLTISPKYCLLVNNLTKLVGN